MTFTVEIQNPQDVMESGHVVHILLDEDELEQLIFDLEEIRTKPNKSLVLTSKSWGVGDLDEEPLRNDTVITHLLKFTKVENTK